MLPEITPQISAKVNRMPGVDVIVTEDCLGCGECTEGICFVDAIRLLDGQALISADCRGCGRCVEICPNEAIDLTIEENGYVDDTILQLSQRVDIF